MDRRDGRARDESGRFAKKPNDTPRASVEKAAAKSAEAKAVTPAAREAKQPEATEKPAAETAPIQEEAKATAAATEKAPQSWKPLAREKWASLPAEVREEVDRREREIATALSQSAPTRKLGEAFQATLQPYMPLIQQQGGDPLRVVGSLLQTVAQLQTAPAQHKAQLVAGIIRQYGVPIEALAAAIDGQPMPAGQGAAPAQPAHMDPDAITQQVMQRLQAQQAEAAAAKAREDAEAFAKDAEFLDGLDESSGMAKAGGVRWLMGQYIQAAAAEGRRLSLQQAYDYACQVHPEVSQVLQQRKAAEAAKAAQASTQRARAASVSVRPQPAGVTAPQPKGIRETLAAVAAAKNFGG